MAFVVLFALAIVVLATSIKVVPENGRGVILRLGRFNSIKSPGIQLIVPFIDRFAVLKSGDEGTMKNDGLGEFQATAAPVKKQGMISAGSRIRIERFERNEIVVSGR
jgi:regulator of protease activity HflC (stomatin/prohibitin superfamily)